MTPDEHEHERDRSSPTPATLGDGALAQSSERYASMFTHHPHATYSVDERGYFTDANDRALEMTGLTLDEMRQAHFAEHCARRWTSARMRLASIAKASAPASPSSMQRLTVVSNSRRSRSLSRKRPCRIFENAD